ncbi:MAG: SRPBCC family protein [Prevotella sp.]|nr:SRPBCC family protein [Prevotella sp.]
MSKFESSVKQIPYPQQSVYEKLSDLNNLETVKDRMPEDKASELEFTHDTIAINIPPVGKISMQVIEREEPKTIKFQTLQSPMPFNLWIQLLPVTDTSSKMKLTIQADINPFIKAMVSKPLQEGIEKIADMLAMIHYE